MSKVKNFELGTILSITTGHICVDEPSKIWKLISFVCDDYMIKTMGFGMINYEVRNHLLTLYPNLKDIKYQEGMNKYEFISKQKEKFGDILPITKLKIKLPKEYTIKTSSYVPSNDSEYIANLIEGFKYDSSKKNKVLTKYKKLVKQNKLNNN